MSLPLLHAGLSAPGISAALDLKFASTLSLTSSSGITPSFSRASSGSYFDSAGVLRYANVNLLTYSEQFNDASWAKSASTISANSITAPDGKTTADTLTENSANATHFVNKASSTSAGTIYTSSIYAKAGTRKYIDVTSVAQDGGTYRRFNNVFDLETGTWQSTASLNSPANTAYSITSVGNGWYRISSSILAYGSTHFLVVYLSDSATPTRDASNDIVYTGNGTGNFHLWGAQLEASSTVGTYCPTTSSANSAPRFNHTFNGTSWVSRGLLVEEQRTNSISYSNSFATGFTIGSAQLTSGAANSPDGTANGWKLYESASGSGSLDQRRYGNYTITGQNTISIYAKAAERRRILLFANGPNQGAWFDLVSGTAGNDSTWTGATQSIQNVGNGWYRCVMTTGVQATTIQIQILLDGQTTNGGNRVGDGVSGVYIAHIQGESGAFATSLISTNGSTVTRSADVCQITGSDFTSFWNASEGSLTVDADVIGNQSSNGNQVAVNIGNGTSSNRIDIIRNINNLGGDAGAYVRSSNIEQVFLSTASGVWNVNNSYKASFGFKANDFAFSSNGSAVITDASGSVPTANQMAIGNSSFLNINLNGHIARLRYFNKRLTDKQLEDLCKPEEQLKLDLKFSENLSLTPVVGPTPSFSRASTGTYFNASGVLTSAAINAPRFDHTFNGTSWVSRGLLVEEQRTNLLLRSEEIENAYWTKDGLNVTQNSANAPDGSTTAEKIYETTANAAHYTFRTTANSSGTYTISIFMKSAERNWGWVYLASGGEALAFFNLSTGSIGTVSGTLTPSATIASVGNGWYRCSITASIPSSNFACGFGTSTSNGTLSYTGDGSSGIYVWGAQLESGSFPTSYIPTTTAAVTRSADVCQITGTDFSGFWNQGEGSFAAESYVNGFNASGVNYIGSASNGGISQYAFIGRFNGSLTTLNFQVYNGAPFADILYTATSATPTKTAFGMKASDCAASVNGGAVSADTTVTMTTTLTQLEIGNFLGNNYLNGHISRLRYYSIRLPNRLLIAKSQ